MNHPQSGVKIGIKTDGSPGKSAGLPGWGLGITKSKHPEEAWKAIQYFTSRRHSAIHSPGYVPS